MPSVRLAAESCPKAAAGTGPEPGSGLGWPLIVRVAPNVSPTARAPARPAVSSGRASRPARDRASFGRTGRMTGAGGVVGVGTGSPPVRGTRGAARPRSGRAARWDGAAVRRGRAWAARDRDQAGGSLRRRINSRPTPPPRNSAPTPTATSGSTGDAAGLWSATVPAFSWLTREWLATLAAAGLMPEPEALTSEPDQGSATYGNVPPNALSLALTSSPSGGIFAPSSLPSTTWSEISTTSSASRRPFGTPAVSPARTPSRLGSLLGGIEVLSRIISAGRAFGGWLSPGTPVRKTWTRSFRGAAGAGIL